LSAVLWTFRVLVFVLPVVFGAFTYKFCRDLERHRHAARAAAAAEPPIGPNEPPTTEISRPAPAPAPAPATPGRFDRLRRTWFGVVILFVLRRAAARRERVRR
jgi:hypothetical protein